MNDNTIEDLAAEAERGYDLDKLAVLNTRSLLAVRVEEMMDVEFRTHYARVVVPAMGWREQDATIRELRELVPRVDCVGLCHTYCTNIDASSREREVIRRKHGIIIRRRQPALTGRDLRAHRAMAEALGIPRIVPPPGGARQSCTGLNLISGKCSIYGDRPLVCHAWGAQESMRCPYGCEPDQYLTDEAWFYLSHRVHLTGGLDGYTSEGILDLIALYETPEGRAEYDRAMRESRADDERWQTMHFGLHPELAPQKGGDIVTEGTQPEHQQEAHTGS